MLQRGRLWLQTTIAAASALVLHAPAAADEVSDAAVRAQFRAAYAAAAVGADVADGEELRGYVLHPYLRAARIERALRAQNTPRGDADAAARALLAEQGDAPVARLLRRAWLASLARRALWPVFLEHYDAAAATPELQCQQLNARIAVGDTEGLAAAIRAKFLTGYRLPSECESAFQWLRSERELPEDVVAQRVTLLLDAGQAAFARTVAARLPPTTARPLLERAVYVESPARALAELERDPGRDVPDEVLLEAWSRLTRSAPDTALELYSVLARRVRERGEGELALALAKGLAWDRRPEALHYFARVPAAALDDVGREWWARAAMWAGDWKSVRAAISTMTAAQQADWPWLYWAARAAEQDGDAAAARTLYAAALPGDNYYSAMAAARLGERVVPRLEPIPLDAAKVEAIAATDAFRRVRELNLVGLRELATNEWQHGYALLPAEQRQQAIHLAARLGIHDVAVASATSQGLFNDYELLYPRPYGDQVAAAVKLTEIEPDLLYAVLRQESLFRPDGASAAGALGIAQLTPATARETARRWQLPAPRRADLFDPGIGITLGAARVAELIERFDAQVPLALGAYNAGEGAVMRWLPPRAVDSDVWIENIPYNETRAYVRRVLWHSLVFRWLETKQAQSAREWLREIGSVAAAP